MTALRVGAPLGPRTVESVSAGAMRDVAALLEDPNPIHLDGEAARALGLGDRPVNQGPVNFGYVLDLLLAIAPGARVRALRVRLLANVLAGDRVIAGGRIESIDEEADGHLRLGCAVWLDVEGRDRAVDGQAVVAVPTVPT